MYACLAEKSILKKKMKVQPDGQSHGLDSYLMTAVALCFSIHTDIYGNNTATSFCPLY